MWFWVVKALTTAMGEATSDYSVHSINPVVAVLAGFAVFCVAMAFQLRAKKYQAHTYWFAVVMVAVFGTMCADVLHVRFGVPYDISAPLFAVILAAVLASWYLVEGTLSIHSIYTPRRELFYWATVLATFATGTALGDMTATTLHLGYFSSGLLFLGVIAIPAIGFFLLGFNEVFAFWFAYIVTRPLGASFADWMGFPPSIGGLGFGHGLVAVIFTIPIVVVVAYLAASKVDLPADQHRPGLYGLPTAGLADH